MAVRIYDRLRLSDRAERYKPRQRALELGTVEAEIPRRHSRAHRRVGIGAGLTVATP